MDKSPADIVPPEAAAPEGAAFINKDNSPGSTPSGGAQPAAAALPRLSCTWCGIMVLLGFGLLALAGVRTMAGAGFWTHLAAGRWIAAYGIPFQDVFSYLAPDQPWRDVTWLYDLWVYLLWQWLGAPGMVVFHVALVVLAFVFLVAAARPLAGALAITIALVMAAWLVAPVFQPGPALFCLVFPALYVALLSSQTARPGVSLLIMAPAQWIWANTSASFLLGPVLVLLFAFEAWWGHRGAPAARSSAGGLTWLAVALLAVSALTPYGFYGFAGGWRFWLQPGMEAGIEWISPFADLWVVSSTRQVLYAALAVGAAGLVLSRRKLPLALTALAFCGAFLALRSLLFSAWFAVLAFPFLCLGLAALGDVLGDFVLRGRGLGMAQKAVAVATGLVILGSAFLFMTNRYYAREGSPSAFGLGVAHDRFPDALLRNVPADWLPRRMLNLAVDGGYLAWQRPGQRVALDARSAIYKPATYALLNDALMEGKGRRWQELLRRYQPDAVLVNMSDPAAPAVVRNVWLNYGWPLVYFDGLSALFAPPRGPTLRKLSNARIRQAGLRELDRACQSYQGELGLIFRPAAPPRLVGASRFFMALGRYHDARTVYEILLPGVPDMVTGWINLGICETELNRPTAAVAAFERALRLMPRHATAWWWLARALAADGQTAAAESAIGRARQINTELVDTLDRARTREDAAKKSGAQAPSARP